MQKWKMSEKEVRQIFGNDIEIRHFPRSRSVIFRTENIILSKDLLSKLMSSSTIQKIYVSSWSNWKDKTWLECFARGEKEDKMKTKEAPQ